MAKVTLGQWTDQNEKFIRILKSGLVKRGKNYRYLAKRTGCSSSSVYNRYNDPGKITVNELREYIRAADLSVDEVVDFLFKDRR